MKVVMASSARYSHHYLLLRTTLIRSSVLVALDRVVCGYPSLQNTLPRLQRLCQSRIQAANPDPVVLRFPNLKLTTTSVS
jgi:hypothetical protein